MAVGCHTLVGHTFAFSNNKRLCRHATTWYGSSLKEEFEMRYHFSTLVLSLTLGATSPVATSALADEVPDPIAGMTELTEVVCIAPQNTGSYSETLVRADAEVEVAKILKSLVGAGASAEFLDKQISYVNALRDGELANQIQSAQDCRLMVFNHYSPLVQDWIKQGMQGSNDGSVSVTGDCNATTVDASGNTVTVACN